jgi:hypothetical protein
MDDIGNLTKTQDTFRGYIDSFHSRNYGWHFKPSGTGTYHVTAFISVWDDSIRADDTVRFSFYVKPTPQATILQRTVRVCKGDSAHLEIATNSPAASIEWYNIIYPGRPPVNIGKTYSYIPVGTSTGAVKTWKFMVKIVNPSHGLQCDFMDTITVEVYSLPKVSIMQSGDTLIAGNGVNYQWYRNDTIIPGAAGMFFIPKKTGTFKVAYEVPGSDPLGCKGTTTGIYVQVQETSSIENFDPGSYSVYPNPGKGLFRISWHGAAPEEIIVLNSIGQTVFNRKVAVSDADYWVDLTPERSGLYFIVIKSENGFARLKVSKF